MPPHRPLLGNHNYRSERYLMGSIWIGWLVQIKFLVEVVPIEGFRRLP